jgi:plastocyanin
MVGASRHPRLIPTATLGLQAPSQDTVELSSLLCPSMPSLLRGSILIPLAAAVVIGGSAASVAASKNVAADDNFFDPKKVKVGKGARVTWENTGTNDHTVKFKGRPNEIISPGETTSRKFKNSGVFRYRCTLHAEMRGKVVAGDA